MKKQARRTRSARQYPDISRSVPWATKLLLTARSSGHCQFASCKRYLFEHHVTLAEGNFAQFAHIIAFSGRGPRGRSRSRTRPIHDVSNLMLLCPACHKLIDDNPDEYPVQLLGSYKSEQERRVRQVMSLAPDMRTAVVQFKAPIHGQSVDIPVEQMVEAVQPRFPMSKPGIVIDLNNLAGEECKTYYNIARRKIVQEAKRLYDEGSEAHTTRHISLFALGPIPLLICLGNALSSAFTVELFQRHRDTEDWRWKTHGKPVDFSLKRVRRGKKEDHVALLLSLSGKVKPEQLPDAIDKGFTLYEVFPIGRTPNAMLLQRREDLDNFKRVYHEFLGLVTADHPKTKKIDLFPAIPLTVAVMCGRELLRKKHPRLQVWDLYKDTKAYRHLLTIN